MSFLNQKCLKICEHQLPPELACTHGERWNKTAGVLWQTWMHPGLTNLTVSVPTCRGKASREKVLKWCGIIYFSSGV